MIDRKTAARATNRAVWERPEVRRIQAGNAEVGTQNTNDGGITTS